MIERKTPEEVLTFLQNRVEKTKNLHQTISAIILEDDTALQKIFFSYYFDFSTAIEFILRQILLERYSDEFVKKRIRTEDEKYPTFLEIEEIKLFLDVNTLQLNWREFKQFAKDFYNNIRENDFPARSNDFIINEDVFVSSYTKCRKTRNAIAHGLILQNVEFNVHVVIDYIISFYVLYNYYKTLLTN